MDAARHQLQVLLQQAQGWSERIRRTTYSESVSFSTDPDGSFTITAHWKTAGGEAGSHSKKFTAELLFGPKERWGGRPTLRRLFCSYLRDYMREVLHARGV